MDRISRRQFLARTGVTVGSTVALAAGAGSVAADHDETASESVTIDYPVDVLETHRPRFVTYHLDIEPTALHGWRATSPDFDTDALVYWAEYPYQDGVSPFSGILSDSHIGDHEPVYVYLDESGEPVEYRASVYHWLAGSFYPEGLRFEGDNPVFKPVNPWHQYTPGGEEPGDTPVPLEDLRDSLPVWNEDSGFHSSLAPGIARNPWRMRTRPHWWRRSSTLGISTNALMVETLAGLSASAPVDIGGWSQSATEALDA